MKRLGITFLALAALAAPLTSAQAVVTLFDASNILTGTGNGANGANTSAIAANAGTYGFSANGAAATTALADDFTLTSASQVTLLTFDAYSTSTYPNPPTSPFTGITANIWSAQPGTAGATVLFTSSTLATTAWTGIYRVTSTALTGATRPVMTLSVSFNNVNLAAGTYWASYTITGVASPGTTGSIFVPPVMNRDGTLPIGNSVQSTDGGVTWAATIDTTSGTVVGIPLTVVGNAVPEPGTTACLALAGALTLLMVRRRVAQAA